MPIIATAGEGKNYTPAPEGTHQAVCVDVIYIGLKPNPFKDGAMHHKIDVAWQIDELRDDGKRYVVYKRYTLSLNDKATLRHDLESWRGRPFTDAELKGFDVEVLIGVNCLVNIQHKPSNKDAHKVFANVVSVMPLIKGMAKIAPVGYERHSEQQEQPPADDSPVTDDMPAVDDIPF